MKNILFEFTLKKPQNTKATLENLKAKLKSKGGTLTGNEQSGTIESNGTKGNYECIETSIKISVIKKPSPLIPNKLVENEIRNIFRQISV